MKPPFLSVIIPAYNCAKCIGAALESVAVQSFGDFEVIVVDDGSTDETARIVGGFSAKDNRFRVVRQQNAGPSAARRNGLSYAAGEYVYIMDADDFLVQECFAAFYSTVAETAADMVFISIATESEEGEVLSVSPAFPDKSVITNMDMLKHMLTGYGAVAMYSYFVKRRIFDDRIKWYDDMCVGEDGLVTIQLVYYSGSFAVIQSPPLYRYIRRTGSLSSGRFSVKKAADSILYPERIRDFFRDKPEYAGMPEMLFAIKALTYASLLSHGYFKDASKLSGDIIEGLRSYPTVKRLHLVHAFIKPMRLFAVNWLLGRIFCQYYIAKGKIDY